MSLKLMSTVITNSGTQSRQEEAEKLLKQLLECVQECQKRYGGKTELATEYDSCVAGLCITLEAVLMHGIRTKPALNESSTLKQVSDIVANSLHISYENPTFWPFVKFHLTKHEQDRYAVLKQIWTDTGRGRAWIRSALNERSLERYIHIFLSDNNTLKTYYEDWSLLRDGEKSNLLPNMAAGLGSILFAISIDKPELNNGAPARAESVKKREEPIIEAPLLTHKPNSDKKRKKVARQFISFEDEGALSSSLPSSSSSSISSDNTSIGENKKQKLKKMDSSSEPRKLSFENSGTREKYLSDIPETLTPVAQNEIGELTPISVEVNEHFDSPDDLVEVPTDISAVLTAVELKNKEELEKKQEKIDLLTKENENLKQQVKKYMSMIQMLKVDDELLPRALEELQIDQQPDYKGEVKLYEQKLVQVAEMHAELMDFNIMLQESLSKKDAVLDRLKNELESLRGPIPDDAIDDGSRTVKVWIPSAFLTGSGSSSHHVYQVFLRAGNDEWNIYRRYAQFHALHSDLKKLDPEVASFDFPPKKSIGKKVLLKGRNAKIQGLFQDSSLVEERRKRLQAYLRRVLAHWPELANCNSKFLLEQHLAFFKDVKDDAKNKKTVYPANRRANDNHYTGL